jgi:ribosomal protein S18 acetylase RimI-like enzyme
MRHSTSEEVLFWAGSGREDSGRKRTGYWAAVEIRRARRNEWQELRGLRLRALAEDPDSFARTLGEEEDLPKVRWQEAVGGVIFIVVDREEWIGMAGVHPTENGDAAEIWGMWVRPDRRHQGIGWSLLDAAVGWARSEGSPAVRLGVTRTNDAAYHLYRKAGFVLTGRTSPLRPGSRLSVAEMELQLGGRNSGREVGGLRGDR